jgi:YjbE family integral membrane protein
MSDGSNWLFVPLQILCVDLLLGADNALVIALACRSLEPRDVRQATTIGIAGAIALRLVMTVLATSLLAIPFVKIVGALALTAIAMNISGGGGLDAPAPMRRRGPAADLWSAAAVIVVADAAMGLDNVVALAAIARGTAACCCTNCCVARRASWRSARRCSAGSPAEWRSRTPWWRPGRTSRRRRWSPSRPPSAPPSCGYMG